MERRSLLSGAAAVAAMAALPRDPLAATVTPPGLAPRDIRQKLNMRMIVCRQRPVPDGLTDDTTSNSLNSRMVCFAPARSDITDITLAIPGFGFMFPEVDLPTPTFTVTAAVEYPLNTLTPVYVSGSRNLTVTAGRAVFFFDPCAVVIPAGAQFYVKLFVTWTPGHFWLTQQTAAQSKGEWTARGTGLTDQTLTTAVQTGTSGNGYGPLVYGRLATPIPVVGIIGDSISQSVVAPPDPITGAQFMESALLGQIPVVNVARSSEKIITYLARIDGRQNILREHITHLILALGRNDMNNGLPLSFATDNIKLCMAPFLARGVQVFGVTITPDTTSTDGWVTAANQTPVPNREAQRLDYNAYLRSNWQAMGMTGLWDWAHAMDPTDSGLWNTDGTTYPGNNAAGFATLGAGGSIASCIYGNYNNWGGSSGNLYHATTPCLVYPWPGDPGTGAAITANSSNSNNVDTFTVTAGGSGYLNPPMIAPNGRWTNDGIHPSWRGYIEIIKQTGLNPNMFVL